jgi:N-hydroxyarylamine O-acetyltransferase
LRRLHRAHALSIPFENLDILLGRPIRLDLDSLQAKLVEGRRGGYCFEQNSLFAAALGAIGFEVTPLAARVRMGRSDPSPRTHMVLAVGVDGLSWLTDVGFGGDGLLDPLPFEDERPVSQGAWTYRLRREQDEFVVQSLRGDAWLDLYAFTMEPQSPIDYEVANHFTSTWPRSPFVTGLRVQKPGPDERLALLDDTFIVQRPDKEERTPVNSAEELLAILADRFGLVFPDGTRFS